MAPVAMTPGIPRLPNPSVRDHQATDDLSRPRDFPRPGLLVSWSCAGHVHLIVGSGPLVVTRCRQSLDAGARPVLISPVEPAASLPSSSATLSQRAVEALVEAHGLTWIRRPLREQDLWQLGRKEVRGVVDAVFFVSPSADVMAWAGGVCREHRIPVNVVDSVDQSSFSLLSTYRDGPLQVGVTANGRGCKLASRIRREIGSLLPPNLGAACDRLGRMRRRLQDVREGRGKRRASVDRGSSSERRSAKRRKSVYGGRVKAAVDDSENSAFREFDAHEADESLDQSAQFNQLLLESDLSPEALQTKRIRWLSQICEYWPLQKLVQVSEAELQKLLDHDVGPKHAFDSPSSHAPASSLPQPSPSSPSQSTSRPSGTQNTQANPPHDPPPPARHSRHDSPSDNSRPTSGALPSTAPAPAKKLGRLVLAGSGPGHPDLLTLATRQAIDEADLILADKLVPAGVLDLIPRRTPVEIARKFPGNADRAQQEFLDLAVQGVREGKTVLRLKQGDPFLYGRGGEEVAYFHALRGSGDNGSWRTEAEDREQAHPGAKIVSVLPGITSALSAPLFAGIPVTQRDVADQVLVCTGTGKKGKAPVPPEYVETRTTVFLMGLHRIEALVEELTTHHHHHGRGEGGPPGSSPTWAPSSAPSDNGADPTDLADPTPSESHMTRRLFPRETPCAVIERASCPDQRVIRTTLDHVVAAVAALGSRPPGLLVVGRACVALKETWESAEEPWAVEEGFSL